MTLYGPHAMKTKIGGIEKALCYDKVLWIVSVEVFVKVLCNLCFCKLHDKIS